MNANIDANAPIIDYDEATSRSVFVGVANVATRDEANAALASLTTYDASDAYDVSTYAHGFVYAFERTR